MPLVNHWNYRSRDYATFFFVGYLGDSHAGSDGYTTVLDPEASFSDRAFVETIEYFVSKSKWKYRGDTPFIVCRGFLGKHRQTGKQKVPGLRLPHPV